MLPAKIPQQMRQQSSPSSSLEALEQHQNTNTMINSSLRRRSDSYHNKMRARSGFHGHRNTLLPQKLITTTVAPKRRNQHRLRTPLPTRSFTAKPGGFTFPVRNRRHRNGTGRASNPKSFSPSRRYFPTADRRHGLAQPTRARHSYHRPHETLHDV